MKIYTKTGDSGDTGLVGGLRVLKIDSRIVAIGEVDEANGCLGVAAAHLKQNLDVDFSDLIASLAAAQSLLFEVGSELASPDGRHATLGADAASELERLIDLLTEDLPPLTNFILPGGSPGAAALHLARSVVRRAERAVLQLESESASPVRDEVKIFLNRLSDWLFVAARTVNARQGVPDIAWRPRS